jgi:hypothetical protein
MGHVAYRMICSRIGSNSPILLRADLNFRGTPDFVTVQSRLP